MKTGKLNPRQLEKLVLKGLVRRRKDILLPPALGEDAAVIDFGDEVCVVATDPITGAAENIGRLAVHISCNDLAATGAVPLGIQICLLLPPEAREEHVQEIMTQIEEEATRLGIEVLGGHTEVTEAVKQNVVVATALGRTARDCFIPSGGARPGDALIMSKGAGIEGAGILAADFASLLQEKGVAPEVIAEARGFLDQISVIEEGKIGARYGATALHDVTEGGIIGAVYEMGQAAGRGFLLREQDIHVPRAVDIICRALELNPLCLISSGSMIFAAPEPEKIIKALEEKGIKGKVIGEITPEQGQIVEGTGGLKSLEQPPRDELWRFLEQSN